MTVPTGSVSCRDWRRCAAADVLPLIRAEVDAWRRTLAWDIAEPWQVVDPARQAGQLPGLVASDDGGRPAGWTAYVPHNGYLQVMALAGRDARVIAALVDDLIASDEARTSAATIVCVRDAHPDLGRVLASRGFAVEPYRYLMCGRIGGQERLDGGIARWHDHAEAMAALCDAAYRQQPGIRAFAPGGTSAEWQQYIETIVAGTGCGWFLPESSVVVVDPADGRRDGRLAGGIMLTDLGTGVAHIAQLAVHPAARGRGLARRLVATALAEASRFYERASLLVASSNAPAVRLYESLGFVDHASFVVARR